MAYYELRLKQSAMNILGDMLSDRAEVWPILRRNWKRFALIAVLAPLAAWCASPSFVDAYLCPPGKDIEAEHKKAVMVSGGDFELKYNSCDPYYVYCYLPTNKVDTLAIKRAHYYLCAQSVLEHKPSGWDFMAVCGPGRGNILFVYKYPGIITQYLPR
jgi:hypothetical protein